MHLLFKIQRLADHIEGIGDASGAGDDDGAKIQQPAPDALIHLHAFHTSQKYFNGFPFQETFLDDHALVGDPELGGQIMDPYHQGMDEGHRQKNSAENHKGKIYFRLEYKYPLDPEKNGRQKQPDDRVSENNFMAPGQIDDFFAVQQTFVDITHRYAFL